MQSMADLENNVMLSEIAGVMAAVDPIRAERIAQSITSERSRESALAEIAGAVAGIDPDRAERIAESITDKAVRAWTLSAIAMATL